MDIPGGMRTGVWLAMLLCALALPGHARPAPTAGQGSAAHLGWSQWGGNQYAFAGDNEAIWIGGVGTVLRWDRTSGQTTRFGIEHGLRHQAVLSVAVDAAGNRWFGGDAGASRLDAAGIWTHFTEHNSDLAPGAVIDIAAGTDGSIWFLHSLATGPVTRLLPDQTMRFYPDRATAVVAAYEQVKGTRNRNRLWTVGEDEVWVDYLVYDGNLWHDRRPHELAATPEAMDVDGDGVLWALENINRAVYAWDGNGWTVYDAYAPGYYDATFTTLVVAADDTVWLGGAAAGDPYSGFTAYVGPLPDQPHAGADAIDFSAQAPTTALLADGEGIWALGDNWLLAPQQNLHVIEDLPYYPEVTHTLATGGDTVFIHSRRYGLGSIQTLDDGGTTALDDDSWHLPVPGFGYAGLTAIEGTPGGDVWLAGWRPDRLGNYNSRPTRWRPEGVVAYELPWPDFEPVIDHIFAQSERLTWFVTTDYVRNERTLLRLDDGGTPANTADDAWSRLELPEHPVTLALDEAGRLLAGGNSGLWRREGQAWQRLIEAPYLQNFTLAADGTIFAPNAIPTCTGDTDCRDQIRLFRPDGAREIMLIDRLVRDEYDRVLSVSRHNSLWTIGPGGVIWYLRHPDPHPLPPVVKRYDGHETLIFALPSPLSPNSPEPDLRGSLAVTSQNHLFLPMEGRLLRLSPHAALQVGAQTWLISPASMRLQAVHVQRTGGYAQPYSLQLSGLPADLSVTFPNNPVTVDDAALASLTATDALAPGHYTATLTISTETETIIAPLTLIVTPDVHDVFAPFMGSG